MSTIDRTWKLFFFHFFFSSFMNKTNSTLVIQDFSPLFINNVCVCGHAAVERRCRLWISQ